MKTLKDYDEYPLHVGNRVSLLCLMCYSDNSPLFYIQENEGPRLCVVEWVTHKGVALKVAERGESGYRFESGIICLTWDDVKQKLSDDTMRLL